MNIAAVLARSAGLYGDLPALATDGHTEATYREFAASSARLAAGLQNRFGIQAGDRVAICMSNRTDYSRIAFATWWAGAAIVAINARLHAKEIAYILTHSGASLLFGCPKTKEVLASLPSDDADLPQPVILEPGVLSGFCEPDATSLSEARPDDLAWLFYTSGTTGQPKGAMISHGNLLSMTQGYFSDVEPVEPGAAILHMAPMSHGSGLYALPFVAAGGVQVVPSSGGFDNREFFDLLSHWPRASMFAAPTMVSRLTAWAKKHKPDHQNLRTIVYGGGPLYYDDLIEAAGHFGPRFAQIYGQGECPMTITSMSRANFNRALADGDESYLRTVGSAFTGTEVSIRDADGNPVPAGENGEIAVRSRTVMPGYWNNPNATSASIRDGWLMTGDLGHLDDRGLLTLGGRAKELIVSAGTNIYPIEVENILTMHPDVQEAAVAGLPDREWGERVVAFILIVDGADPDSLAERLDRHCLAHIARFKRPKQYVFVDDMPKNAYGKIVKRDLLDRYAARLQQVSG